MTETNLEHEEHYLLEYNAKWSVESQPTFRRNIATTCFHADILLGLLDPDDKDDTLLRNVASLSTNYFRYVPEEYTLHNHRC
jgi:hypothetical protein